MTSPRHAAEPGRTFESFADFFANSACSPFLRSISRVGTGKASLVRAEQSAIDLIDPAYPDYTVQFDLRPRAPDTEGGSGAVVAPSARTMAAAIDVGDGLTTTVARTENHVAIGPPNTEARYKLDAPHELWVLGLPSRWVDPILAEVGVDPSVLMADAGRFVRRPNAASVLRAVRREVASGERERPLFFDGLILQLLSALTDRTALSPLAPIPSADARIARVVDYVEDNIGEPFDLDRLAAVAGLSRTHLMRVFRATVGQSVWTFVQHRRVDRARRMLSGSAPSLAQIALACGFANQTHMTRAFRAVLGTTPGAVRRAAS